MLEDVLRISYSDQKATWTFRKLDGTVLALMDWDVLSSESNPRLYKPYFFQCGQHLLAKILTEACAKYPTTQILFGHELKDLQQDENGVTLSVSKKNGDTLEIHGDWVIGADGGKSATRKLIGSRFEGFSWDQEAFVALNVHFPFHKYGYGPANFIVGGKDWAVCGRCGPEGDPWRVAYGIETGKSDEWVLENAKERLEKMYLPGPEPYEIVQAAQYRVHQLQVKQYKVGRVVLAGDAAHLNNPIGGFGLSTGMTDAGCIAEALSLVVNGQKPESFLQAACDARLRVFRDISNPGSQRFKSMVQEDPNNMPTEDIQFFEKLHNDKVFQKEFLLGGMRMHTPVEDIKDSGL